jgi:hypothetical protein
VILIAGLSVGTTVFYRYVLPILVPLLAVAAASVLDLAARARPRALALAIPALAIATLAEPVDRCLDLIALLRRKSTLEIGAKYVEESIPAGKLVTSPQRASVLGFGPSSRIALWDPVAVAESAEAYVVCVWHPQLPQVFDTDLIRDMVEASGALERVFEARALEAEAWERATFDQRDPFFYPLRGFEGVLRGGPDIEVFRVRGGLSAIPESDRPRPSATAERTADGVEARVAAPPGAEPRYWLYRVRSVGDAGPAPWSRTMLLRPRIDRLLLDELGYSGDQEFSFSARTETGFTAWSEPVRGRFP